MAGRNRAFYLHYFQGDGRSSGVQKIEPFGSRIAIYMSPLKGFTWEVADFESRFVVYSTAPGNLPSGIR